MPNEYIINGDADISFAMSGAGLKINNAAPTIGYAQSSDSEEGGDKWEGRGPSGNVVSTVLYNHNGPVTCQFILINGATLPVRGDVLEVDGKQAVIETAKIARKNTDGTTIDITAHWYEGITPAIPT